LFSKRHPSFRRGRPTVLRGGLQRHGDKQDESRPGTGERSQTEDDGSRARIRLRRLTIAILLAGFGAAAAVYFAAGPEPENPLGYDPLENKRFVHDLELYGGKANVLAAEFRDWFTGLWYGRNLAFTIAAITILVVLFIRFFVKKRAWQMDAGPPHGSPLRPRAGDDAISRPFDRNRFGRGRSDGRLT
jgi:hypothetical protein